MDDGGLLEARPALMVVEFLSLFAGYRVFCFGSISF